MRNAFCTKVELLFTDNPYDIERLSDAVLYAYDCKQSKRTFFTASAEFCEKSLKITNNEQHEIVHICVDGGLIQYGFKEKQFSSLEELRNQITKDINNI